MVKRLMYCLIFLFILLPLISAGSIGISPSKVQLFFEPNLEKTFTFKAFSSDPNQYISIELRGDLTEYVTISKTRFLKGGQFDVHVELPASIDIPGNHRILIAAVPAINESLQKSVLGGKAVVQTPIDIFVPYPGKYVEAEFEIDDVSEGENALYKLNLHSLGTDFVAVSAWIELFKENDDKPLMTHSIVSSEKISSKESHEVIGLLNSSELEPGSYLLKGSG